MKDLEQKVIEAFNRFETEVNFESTDLQDEIFEILKQLQLKAVNEKIEIYKKIEKEANEGYIVPFHKYIKDLKEQKKLLK